MSSAFNFAAAIKGTALVIRDGRPVRKVAFSRSAPRMIVQLTNVHETVWSVNRSGIAKFNGTTTGPNDVLMAV